MERTYEGHLFRGEREWPTLYLDDVSAIPFLVNIAGVEEYQHRARVRASDGDLFATVTPPAPGYEVYCRERLRLGAPEDVVAEPVGSPLAVAEACSEGAAFARIAERARQAGGLLVHPYMSIEPVWRLAQRVSSVASVEVKVIGPPPPVTWLANDKKSFFESRIKIREVGEIREMFPIAIYDQVGESACLHLFANLLQALPKFTQRWAWRFRSTTAIGPGDLSQMIFGLTHKLNPSVTLPSGSPLLTLTEVDW